MKKIPVLICVILFLAAGFVYADLSGRQILQKVDNNYTANNKKSAITLIIRGERGTRTMKSQSWVQGVSKAYTEFLAPPRDAGTKMLKLGDELWTYYPATDRVIQIAGHMLRQSMMGSDVSYEDYMEDPVLSNLYDAQTAGSENFNSRDCYVLQLTAKKEDIAYYTRKMWVDKERFLPLKEERYAKSGALLKRFTINEVFKVEGRWYPKNMTFKDMMQSGGGTDFIVDSIDFDADIPDYVFSKASLKK